VPMVAGRDRITVSCKLPVGFAGAEASVVLRQR
jgi:hypothetical protein